MRRGAPQVRAAQYAPPAADADGVTAVELPCSKTLASRRFPSATAWEASFDTRSVPSVRTSVLRLPSAFIAAVAAVTPKPRRSALPFIVVGGLLGVVLGLGFDHSTRTYVSDGLTASRAPMSLRSTATEDAPSRGGRELPGRGADGR